ncbi:MAG: hypothetical protein ACYDCI_03620 [Candidatus Limnocylindrales bacterium]
MQDRPARGFQRDVKPLFRDRDRPSMAVVFDLWSYDDLRKNAAAIARMTEAAAMSCDRTWPRDRTRLFRAWLDGGFQA